MQTPETCAQALGGGGVTEQMLSDCLFSVNKRAKNCRDEARYYRELRDSCRDYRDPYLDFEAYQEARELGERVIEQREMKDEFYRKKEILLTVIEPACIHRDAREWKEIRFWEYDGQTHWCHALSMGRACAVDGPPVATLRPHPIFTCAGSRFGRGSMDGIDTRSGDLESSAGRMPRVGSCDHCTFRQILPHCPCRESSA